jgi:heme exporter protein A
LKFWASIYGSGSAEQALEKLGAISFAHLRGGKLSAGQRRRVDLARAVLVQREVWLLDEPTAALDSDGVAIVRSLIDEHLARGGIAVVATHDDLGSGFKRLELAR